MHLSEVSVLQAKLGLWSTWVDEEAVVQAEIASAAEKTERTINYRKVVVTDVQRGNFKFAAQSVDDGNLIAITS